jgi:hypothetical protein
LKKPKPGQTDQFRSGPFFGQKPVQTGLAWFWLGFSVWLGCGSVFPVWLGFFLVFLRFGFGSVRFFQFFAYKTETEPNRPVFLKF